MKKYTVKISKAQITDLLRPNIGYSDIGYSDLEKGFWEFNHSIEYIQHDLEKIDEHLLSQTYVDQIMHFLATRCLEQIEPWRLMVFVDNHLISHLNKYTEMISASRDTIKFSPCPQENQKNLEEALNKVDWENLKDTGSTDIVFAVDLKLYTENVLREGEVLILEFE